MIFDVIVFPLAASCYFVIWVTKMHDFWTIFLNHTIPFSNHTIEACQYLSKRLTHEHHVFGKLKSNGSGGGICTWVIILIPLLTPCNVTAQKVKVKTQVQPKPGTRSLRQPQHQLTPQVWCVQQRLITSPPQARNAALTAMRAGHIPLHFQRGLQQKLQWAGALLSKGPQQQLQLEVISFQRGPQQPLKCVSQ